jgi:hypothetical protein
MLSDYPERTTANAKVDKVVGTNTHDSRYGCPASGITHDLLELAVFGLQCFQLTASVRL